MTLMKAGTFVRSLVVLAALCSALSARAAAPTIAPIPDYSVYVDQPALVEILVSDAETPTNQLSLRLTTSNSTLVDTNKDVLIRWFADGGPTVMPRWYATIAPRFGQTGTATNTVTVSDGTSSASATFVLTVIPPPAYATRFANTNSITLPASGVAGTYPSTNVVTGMVGTVTNIIVTFSRLSHQNPNDLHMLLVSPSGQAMVPWSKVGGGGPWGGVPPDHAVTNCTAALLDAAPDWAPLPEFYYIWTERFRPGDYAGSEPPANSFPAPAPAGPYVPTLVSNAFHNAFNGLNPNGTWSLYIYDDQTPYTGSIAGGWSLTVLTTGPQPAITDITDQTILTNTSTAALAFTISDPDTPIGSLTLGKASSNQTLVPTNNIVFGGSGSNRTVTVTPAPGLTGTSTITVSVSDGTYTVNDTFLLTVISSLPTTGSFTNAAFISIVDTNAAVPYPSSINVSGMTGTVSSVTVTLNNFNQTWGSDVDVVLVGPAGQKAMLMSDCGAGSVGNVTLTLSNAAPNPIPASSLVSGVYHPTDLTDASPGGDTFPAPAPAGPYDASLTNFNGASPNGVWSLYVHDDGPGDVGNFSGGWSLTITALNTGPSNTAPTITAITNQTTFVNTPTAAIPFTVGDVQTSPSNLVVTASSSNGTLAPTNRITLGGAGANRTVTLAPSSNQLGSATITLTVSDGLLTASNSFTLTVNPAPLTVTANDLSRGYGLTNPVLTGSVVGLQAGDIIAANYSTSADTNSPPGSYPITFTLSDPGGKLGIYTVTTNNGTLTVTNALLSLTASNLSKVYGTTRTLAGDEYFVSGGTLFNGNTITNLALASAGTNVGASVGSYPVTVTNATGPGLANYLISYVPGSFTVTAAPLTVTAGSSNKVYGATRNFAGNEFTITSGALVNGNTLTNAALASGGASGNAPVGSYAITATNAVGLGSSNYAITYVTGTLTVTSAPLTITAGSSNKVYGVTRSFAGNEFAITSGGLFNGDTIISATIASVGANGNAPVGGYAITITNAAGLGASNYSIAYVPGTLTVGVANLLITALDTNKVYGTTINPADYSVTGLLNSDTVTNVALTSVGSVSNAPVGVHPILASAAGGVGLTNYTIGYSNGVMTVGAANLLITALDTNKVYGATLNPVDYIVTGLLNSDTVTNVALSSVGGVSNAPVGAHAILASAAGGAGLTNYTIGYSNGVMTVGTANLFITALDTNKAYGATLNPIAYSVSGLMNDDSVTNLSLTSAGSATTALVGTYPIGASAAGGAGLTNYFITYNAGVMTVAPASLTVTAHDTNKIYGAIHSFAGTEFAITGGALFNGDTLTNALLSSAGAASNAPVGIHPIAVASAVGAGSTNYTIAYNAGSMAVGVAQLLITAGSTNKVYGETLNPGEFAVAGLLEGDNVSGVTLVSSGSASNANAGVHPIVASDASGSGLTNYVIAFSNGTLTVSQAILTATADDKSRNFGQPNPALTISYAGFVNGEGTNVLDTLPVAATTATNVTPPGIYSITAAGGADDNYAFNYVAGSLAIAAPGNVVITNAQLLDADNMRLVGTGDPGVSYKVQKSVALDVWETLGTATPDETGVFEFIDATAGADPIRFYRLTFP